MTRSWTNIDTGAGVLHARAGAPDRWDVEVSRVWPVAAPVSRRRLAYQVRQDIWRALQSTRGFTPRVLVATATHDHREIHVTGGGTLSQGRAAPVLADRIADILDNPDNRRRWAAHARARRRLEGDPCSTRS